MISTVRIIPVSLHFLRRDQNVSPVLPSPCVDLAVDVLDVGRIAVSAVAATDAGIIRHVPGRIELFVQPLILGRVSAVNGTLSRLLRLDRRNGAEENDPAQRVVRAFQRTGSHIRAERCQPSNSASRDLSPKQPPAVAFAARAETVNTLLGAERRAPGIVADQAKLAAAHRTAVD